MKQAERAKSARQVECAFCGGSYPDDEVVVGKSPQAVICPACLSLCRTVAEDGRPAGEDRLLRPSELKAKVDEYVVGQEHAKKVLVTAAYNHQKRVARLVEGVEKSSVLLVGPTGCGKSLLVRTVANLLKLPFVCVSAATLTSTGYVGHGAEDVVAQLYAAAGSDVAEAEKGVVFVDEADKLVGGGDRDFVHSSTQQELLTVIEGTDVYIPNGFEREVKVNTSQVLFVLGGAFTGIDRLINRRVGGTGLGFGAVRVEGASPSARVIPEDLIAYGLIPELVGRVQVIAELEPLTEESLVRVLSEPKNSLVNQYSALLRADGLDLKFEPAALRKIASIACRQRTGARGLRSIVESTVLEYMYSVPVKKGKGLKPVVVGPEQVKYE